MKKKSINITMGIVVFAVLFGLIAPIQAPGVSFTIYGQVFDVDGTTPVNGVTVTVTNLETGSSVDPTVTANGGYYSVNLGNLKPDPSHSEGDMIQIFADDGAGKTNTTIVPRAAASPQRVDLILEEVIVPPVKVVINEFEQNPPGDETGNEWVELYNNGSTSVNISGWKLANSGGKIVTIPPGTEIAGYGYWVTNWTNGSLVNRNENITLYNATGVEVDKTLTADDGYNDERCWARFPNGIDTDIGSDWQFQASTMGTSNGPVADTIAPTTTVTVPSETTPIPSGEILWKNTTVMLTFHRSDNTGGTGVNYTNLSATPSVNATISNNSWTWDVTLTGENISVPLNETLGDTFNVTISDECNAIIEYYSVDKATPPNPETVKNLTVRIDKTPPVIISVTLNKTLVNASEPILVSVNATDALSGIANVTADGVKLTKQSGNWWNGTIHAATTPGLHNVTVIAYDNASNTETNDTVQYEVITVAPSIITYAPVEAIVNDTAGAARTFNITVDQIVNVTWQINETEVFNETDVNESTYSNMSAVLGYWNVSAIVENVNGTAMHTWMWNVTVAVAVLMEGDVDMDMHVEIADAMLIAQYKADLISLNASQLKCADTTDDGIVSMADAMHIAQWKCLIISLFIFLFLCVRG